MQKSQSLRLGGERRRLSGGVFHQRLHADPVRPGDVLYIPAGTVHALGGGICCYEIQQNMYHQYNFAIDYGYNQVES